MNRGPDDDPRAPACGAPETPASVRPLASIVRGEAARAEAAGRIDPDPVRLAAGWQYRFVIERGRAADFARLYEERGFDVALDPVAPARLAEECADCRLVAAFEYVQVYTRRR